MTLLTNLWQRWMEWRRRAVRFWCEVQGHDADVVSWHRGRVSVPVHMHCTTCGSESEGWR